MLPNYKVEIDDDALSDLEKLTKKVQGQILKAIKKLSTDPRQGNVTQLRKYDGLHRLRTGKYRAIYAIDDEAHVVVIIAAGHRKDVYDILERRIK
ncbi:type II toxin-antitoxin system RelE family toxin [Fibrella forsythiae]|uniref:Type II toxin-antitoxin system RelE/ParE family toxin n=1 Tax=Fibrella forsythiae TaxID=2817061 RepID=A0ABS3JDD4_9BACT|nr:type II toxin-antitoxin system RelE/ParE family toxin [Fibrella forsythiae]MBO0947279.1 type II toxin-antitoxin system RelE/ParE family toxin [Fibrella forsythiae]